MKPKYSFIVPIYNEEENISEMYRRISAVMDQMDGPVELLLIDDGSRDCSLQMLRDLHHRDSRVSYLSFARNFGHQIAVTAGLNFAKGQVVVVMDADLQDPPEVILDIVQKWREGYQVVYARRTQRRHESWSKRLFAYWFYRVLNNLADVDIPTDTGDFCLMDRQVVDALNAMPERHRYIRGLRSWVGFRQTAISFERDPRFAGEAKYTFVKSLTLAFDGLVSFSKVPLRIAIYVGLLSSVVATLMALLVLYWRFFQPHSPVIGFASIATVIFFLGAVQLVGIGFVGEYVGRIYEEVKGRPLYILREAGGFRSQAASRRISARASLKVAGSTPLMTDPANKTGERS
jgi:glycosyltransferase involved in cell wall biosynthesis